MFAPAARLNDNHLCPFQTPAVVPIPHVGGPILFMGAMTCLIEGMPAARVGDMAICVGPPAPIISGSFTVLIEGAPAARMGDQTAHGGMIIPPCAATVYIGDMGQGAGSMAVATMSAARNNASAFVRTDCAAQAAIKDQQGGPFTFEGDPTKKSWIEIELVDQHNKPVPHVRYRVVPPGAGVKPIEGFLNADGFAKITGIDPGTCKITFPDLDAANWKPELGDPGKRTRPEPPPPDVGLPGVRATSVHLEVVQRPPGVRASSVVHTAVVTPGSGVPGVKASTVKHRVVNGPPSVQAATVRHVIAQRAPSVKAASVTLRVLGALARFDVTASKPAEATVSWNSLSDTQVGDRNLHSGDAPLEPSA